MKKDNQSSMVNSQTVNNQLNQLEKQIGVNNKNKAGTTNEIQPVSTDEGLTQ